MGQGEKYNGLDPAQWNTLHISAIFVITLSVTGSLYIIISTLRQYRCRPSMTFVQFLPFFISISDITFGLFHGADHIHNLYWSYGPDPAPCTLLGAGMVYGMNLAAFWTVATAAVVYIVVVRMKSLDAGRWFWKFTIPCFGIPLLTTIISVAIGAYKWQYMFCGLDGVFYTTLFNTGFIILAWFINAAVYTRVLLVIQGQKQATRWLQKTSLPGVGETSGSTIISAKSEANETLMVLGRKLPWFVIAYIITWLPWTVYSIGLVIDADNTNAMPFWLLLLIVTCTNAGGVANAIMYRFFLFGRGKSRECDTQTGTALAINLASVSAQPKGFGSSGLPATV